MFQVKVVDLQEINTLCYVLIFCAVNRSNCLFKHNWKWSLCCI